MQPFLLLRYFCHALCLTVKFVNKALFVEFYDENTCFTLIMILKILINLIIVFVFLFAGFISDLFGIVTVVIVV